MRQAKPWYRKSTKTWYVQLDGRQVPLGKDKDEAFQKYHQLMTGRRSGQEARIFEAAHVRDDHIVLAKVDSKGKRYNRVVWLTPTAQAIIQQHVEKYPEGKLFRNKWGRPWMGGRLNERCTKIAKKLRHSVLPVCVTAYLHHGSTGARG